MRADVEAYAKKHKELELEFKAPKVQFNPYLNDAKGHEGTTTYTVNLTNTKSGVTMHFYLTIENEVGEPTLEIALQALVNEAYTVMYHGSSVESWAKGLGLSNVSNSEKWYNDFLLNLARRQSFALREVLGDSYVELFPSEKPKRKKAKAKKKEEKEFW